MRYFFYYAVKSSVSDETTMIYDDFVCGSDTLAEQKFRAAVNRLLDDGKVVVSAQVNSQICLVLRYDKGSFSNHPLDSLAAFFKRFFKRLF